VFNVTAVTGVRPNNVSKTVRFLGPAKIKRVTPSLPDATKADL